MVGRHNMLIIISPQSEHSYLEPLNKIVCHGKTTLQIHIFYPYSCGGSSNSTNLFWSVGLGMSGFCLPKGWTIND